MLEGLPQQSLGSRFHQVETLSRIDNRADNEGFLYGRLARPRIALILAGELKRTLGIILPEVNPVPQPVLVILTLPEMLDFAPEKPLAYTLVAAVKTEDKRVRT